MTSPFPKPGQRGFSLLEVLVAVVILSLGLLALASLQGALIRSATDSKAQSLAMAIAKQKIEQLAAYQTLGGAEACVSPTAWTSTSAASCYRMITDEGSTEVDGKPYTTAIDPMGGIRFFVATVVSRYVYNVNTNVYDLVTNANDTALDAALVTSPETLLPGKEFKRIVVDVTWTDATAVLRHVQVEDALNGIVPRDSIAIVNNRKGMTARYAESIVVDPGTIAGVIPIAVGNGSNTAASNPTPELKGRNDGTYVAETRFDVYTYIPLSGNKALAQSRVETAVVGCRCDTTTASTIEAPLRPTYWNGVRYVIPTKANYVGLTGSAPLANRPLAGPLALGNGDSQSDQCRVCCRDHHDPAGDDANTDSRSALAFYSPRRVGSDGADVGTDPDPAHTHYLVSNNADTRTLVASGPYSEVCRMIRVDGIFRVAADLNNDYYALLQARNSGASSFVPSDDVADDYGDMVKKYLGARVSDNTNAATYNNATSPADPYSTTYTQGSRVLPDTTTRTYDLNEPAAYPLELSDDAAWLHARGLYVDYMGPEAIARIEQAKTDCPFGTPLNECVLPYLPFTSINLSELVAWKDEAITPDPAAFATVIKVLNNGFELATGDATFIETTGSGSSLTNPLRIDFSSAISGSILEGMAVSGTGIGDNAIVVSITNGRRRVEVDVANSATFSEGGNIVFQAAPIRGRVTPGTATAVGYASNARATATYNNAAIALRFSMNPEEQALVATSNTDAQRFNMSGGTPPPPSNSFTVSTFTGYPGNPANQFFLAYGAGDVVASVGQPCSLTSVSNVNVLPFVCSPGSGLPGGMSILLSNYNFMDTTQTATTPIPNCTNSDGKALLAGGGPVTYSPLLQSPATNYSVKKCYNYAVDSATNVTPNPDVAGQFNQTVVSPGLLAEATPIFFNSVSSDDDISIVFGTPTITTQAVTCTFTCSKANCAASGNKKTYTVTSPNCP